MSLPFPDHLAEERLLEVEEINPTQLIGNPWNDESTDGIVSTIMETVGARVRPELRGYVFGKLALVLLDLTTETRDEGFTLATAGLALTGLAAEDFMGGRVPPRVPPIYTGKPLRAKPYKQRTCEACGKTHTDRLKHQLKSSGFEHWDCGCWYCALCDKTYPFDRDCEHFSACARCVRTLFSSRRKACDFWAKSAAPCDVQPKSPEATEADAFVAELIEAIMDKVAKVGSPEQFCEGFSKLARVMFGECAECRGTVYAVKIVNGAVSDILTRILKAGSRDSLNIQFHLAYEAARKDREAQERGLSDGTLARCNLCRRVTPRGASCDCMICPVCGSQLAEPISSVTCSCPNGCKDLAMTF